ncbi:hypothetical protein Scep_007722 [Stephania cephalantha]|uniref:Uncharacterized protein n=1 Tax=Stephania cephalantha TaxID=152367 RepID=A0AAP0KD24_9MAGN
MNEGADLLVSKDGWDTEAGFRFQSELFTLTSTTDSTSISHVGSKGGARSGTIHSVGRTPTGIYASRPAEREAEVEEELPSSRLKVEEELAE